MFVFGVCAVVNLCLSESENLHTIANTVHKSVLTTSHIWVVFTHMSRILETGLGDVETVYIEDAIKECFSQLFEHISVKGLKSVML